MNSRIRTPFYIFFLNPVYVAARSLRSLRSNNLIQEPSTATSDFNAKNSSHLFGLSLLVTNTMSLAPKIDEVNYFATRKNPDLICLTETWLTEAISENCINIPGYYLICKNRPTGAHGGVCVYINNLIQYKTLDQLHHPKLEVLWVYIRPKRLPRGIPCIVTGIVYHPPSADDNIMVDYLSSTFMSIEGLYPGCGIFLTGDFNRLNINRLLAQFSMKKLVRVPTRGDNILDLIITSMPKLYAKEISVVLVFSHQKYNT